MLKRYIHLSQDHGVLFNLLQQAVSFKQAVMAGAYVVDPRIICGPTKPHEGVQNIQLSIS